MKWTPGICQDLTSIFSDLLGNNTGHSHCHFWRGNLSLGSTHIRRRNLLPRMGSRSRMVFDPDCCPANPSGCHRSLNLLLSQGQTPGCIQANLWLGPRWPPRKTGMDWVQTIQSLDLQETSIYGPSTSTSRPATTWLWQHGNVLPQFLLHWRIN